MLPSQAPAEPRLRFYRMIEQARLPQRADRSAAGTLPTRAFRYCEAVATASSFGWYVFPPMDFSVVFDGDDLFWTYDGVGDWLPLTAAQFPRLGERFDRAAPEPARGYAPPFLTALAAPGTLQIWSGLLARTAPGWSLLVRPLANLTHGGGFTQYEGIVETDRWFGPLFTNLRITRTGVPVRFRAEIPLIQAQALPRDLYADETQNAVAVVPDLDGLDDADWAAYCATIVRPSQIPDRPLGQYAIAARKRRRGGCPFGHDGAIAGRGEKTATTVA